MQADKTKALFQVAVAFETRGMAFTPNETAILDEINANTLEGIVSVAQVRLITHSAHHACLLLYGCCGHTSTYVTETKHVHGSSFYLGGRYGLCLQAAPRVLFMRAFAHLFEGKPSGLNTLNILRSNGHMNALQHAINQAVINDFIAAKEAVRVGMTVFC